jgi:uncharacterized membrane protein
MSKALPPRTPEGRSDGDGPSGSLTDLTRRNVEVIAQLEGAAGAKRSRADRVADLISGFVGSMVFVYIHVLWFAVWIIVNSASVVPAQWHFDPYPYTFLTFVVSLEAIFLSTFILISQNHEERLARRRNHLDLQINLLSEQENSTILKMLASIERRLKIAGDPDIRALAEDVEPEKVVAQIEDAIESSHDKNGHRKTQ